MNQIINLAMFFNNIFYIAFRISLIQAFAYSLPSQYVQVFIEGLCHGNMLEEEAISLSNIFKMNFSIQPLPTELWHRERVLCLPPGANLVRDASVKNKLETNSVTELHFQIE